MGYSKLLALRSKLWKMRETEAVEFPKQIQEARMAGKEISVVYKQGLPSQ